MPIKILLVTPTQGGIGGIEQFYSTVASFLRSDKRFYIKLLVKVVSNYELSGALSSVLNRVGAETYFYRHPSGIPTNLLRWSDIVYTQNPIPEVCLFAKLFGKKLAITHHNWLQKPNSLQGIRWRLSSAAADFRWYNSNFVRNTWEKTPPNENSESFPTISNVPMKMSQFEGRKGFTFISRWIPNKGVEILLEAYQTSNVDRSLWPLTMMGSGPLLDKLTKSCQNDPINGLTITGFVSEEEKFQRIGASRWHITPPCTFEDMGLTPLEARSVGVPCIVSDDGGVPEVCGPGAIVVRRGDVDSLRDAIEKVTEMSSGTYEGISKQTFFALQRELRTGEFYRQAFLNLYNS